MKSLIFGASGQVGQALIHDLDKRGWKWEGSCHEHPIDSRLFKVDLADLDKVTAHVKNFKPEVVYMPSGFTWVDGCEDQPERAMRVNTMAPEAVAYACKQLGAALVYYSTDYIFGEHGGPYSESAKPAPLGVYGASKLEGEQRVLLACPRALVLRTTVVYGPEPQGKNFVYQLLKNLLAGVPMTVPNDQLASPTYNRDLAHASVELVNLKETGVWNVAGPTVMDRYAFAKMAAEVFSLNGDMLEGVDTASLKQKAKRPLDGGLEVDKLVSRLGWRPQAPMHGLQEMRKEMESNGQLAKLRAMT